MPDTLMIEASTVATTQRPTRQRPHRKFTKQELTGIPGQFVPNRLRILRERHRRDSGFYLTLEEVAKIIGSSKALVSRHESNDPEQQRLMTDEDVQAYAALYKVEPHEIFKGLTAKSPRRT